MEITRQLKALGDHTRMQILRLLLTHNDCVRCLAGRVGISEAAVSQHLKILRQAGLVTGQRKGRFIHYRADRQALRALAHQIEGLSRLEQPACPQPKERQNSGASCRCHRRQKGGAEE